MEPEIHYSVPRGMYWIYPESDKSTRGNWVYYFRPHLTYTPLTCGWKEIQLPKVVFFRI
jgi:hypothetical protein